MEYEASSLRARLDSLLRSVTGDPQTQEVLSSNGDVPSQFLGEHGISLFLHEFDKTGNSAAKNLNLDPPLLFAHCPLEFFQKHPIDTSRLLIPRWAIPILHYAKFKEGSTVARRVCFTADYLYRWAGGGIPRKGTLPGFSSISELRGLVNVR